MLRRPHIWPGLGGEGRAGGRLWPSVTENPAELPHPQGSQGQRGHFSVKAECWGALS